AIEAAASSRTFPRTSAITTFIPAPRQARAIPSPMPLAAAVMKATLCSRCSIASLLGLGIEPHGNAAQARCRVAIPVHDERMVTRDDVIRAAGELPHPIPSGGHLRDAGNNGERAAGGHVRKVVGGVGGKHDPTDPRADAHHLQSESMAADVMHADT